MRNIIAAAVIISASIPMLASGQPGDPPPPIGPTAVFLLDSSLGTDANAYKARVEQLKKVLETEPAIKKFNVLVFDVAGRWVDSKGFLVNDAETRQRVLKQLGDVVPEGACDLAAALDRLTTPLPNLEKGAGVHVYLLSEGEILLGESNAGRLSASFRARCPFPVQFTCMPKTPDGGDQKLFKALQTPLDARVKPASREEIFDQYLAQVGQRVKVTEGKHGEHVKLLIKSLAEKDFDYPASPKDDKLPQGASEKYLKARADNLLGTNSYLTEAKRRADAGDVSGSVRTLTSLLPLFASNADVQRSVGYRLFDAKQTGCAVRLFERLQQQRPDDPHAYRDLARAYEDAGMHGLAAIQYEIVLAGTWDNKYAGSLKEVAQEEYGHMMRDAIRRKAVSNKLIDVFGERLEGFDSKKLQADLRVTISWNTDLTDIDLWVIEPGGEKCFYGHQKTSNGGELTQDITNGYGPERYQMIKAKKGEYQIIVHFYGDHRGNNQVVEGTHVNVVVRRNAGTPQEVSQRTTVILRRENDQVEVAKLNFE
jgi:tetratricopeptide (TPR) repeat protein